MGGHGHPSHGGCVKRSRDPIAMRRLSADSDPSGSRSRTLRSEERFEDVAWWPKLPIRT